MLESSSNEQLIAAVAAGDTEALGALYVRHRRMVRAGIRRFAPEIPQAELDEQLQEVFLAVSGAAARYREQGRFTSWLYGITVRTARSWRRSTWLHRKLTERFVSPAADQTPSPARETEIGQAVRQALLLLPRGQREVLLLHVVEGFRGDEIAEILGIRPRTVRTRLHRARQRLQRSVAADLWAATLGEETP